MQENNDSGREAMDRLNRELRILTEARMADGNKPLNQEQHNAIIDHFEGYIAKHGITLAQVGREIRYAESTLSQWRKNEYRGDMDTVSRAVNNWMERDARRRAAEKPKDCISTFAADTIRSIIQTADEQNLMAAIVAPSGCGKTKVLQVIHEQTRGIMITANQASTARGNLVSLARACGRNNDSGSSSILLRDIIDRLTGTRRMVLIDEAHLLGKSIGHIRSIYDQAGVPIIMVGTADILRMIDDRTDGRGQFSSRTIRCNLLDLVRNAEDPDGNAAGRDLFTIEEIKAYFAMRQMRLADDGLRLAWALACLPNHGCLRLVGNLAAIAAKMYPEAQALTRAHLLQALQLLVGGEAKHLRTLAERHEGMRVAKVA